MAIAMVSSHTEDRRAALLEKQAEVVDGGEEWRCSPLVKKGSFRAMGRGLTSRHRQP